MIEHKYPLFILFGASGSGKSTILSQLIGNQDLVVVMEGDLLWRKEFNTPENGYREFRDLWLKMCLNISQSGKSVLLSQCGEPSHYEASPLRQNFSKIYYLALICDNEELRKRLKERPASRDCSSDQYIKDHQIYNDWLKENASTTSPPMDLIDNTSMSIEDTVSKVIEWLNKKVEISERK